MPTEATKIFQLEFLMLKRTRARLRGSSGDEIYDYFYKNHTTHLIFIKFTVFSTQSREDICLITAKKVMYILTFIVIKVMEKSEENDKLTENFHLREVLLVQRKQNLNVIIHRSRLPNIVGRAGRYENSTYQNSSAYVCLLQISSYGNLAEHSIDIVPTNAANDVENSKNACLMILAKIVEDPQSGTCLNVSYADITGPVANPNPTGSPFANSPPQAAQNGNMGGGLSNPLSAVSGLGNLLGGGVNLTLNLSSAYPNGGAGNPVVTGQLLEHVRNILRSSGFADQSNAEVCQAINTLINYGIIGLGLGLGNPGQHQGQGGQQGQQGQQGMANSAILGANMNNSNNPNDQYHGSMSNGNNGPFGPIGTTVASGLNLGQGLGGPTSPQRQVDRFNSEPPFDPFRRQSTEMGGGLPLNSNSFGLGTPLRKSPSPGELPPGAPDGTKKVEVEVGEHIVGAILGPGGKSLVEIQHISGTTIQISKKGNYAPGTRNRIVTITGLPSGISTAQFLIEQRISEEESKRARQNAIMGVMP
ncbi:unnamed protein product, partial [Meganyctiphanes norvegica]